jgi:N,N'-diacetylchitobiose transport system permease protein
VATTTRVRRRRVRPALLAYLTPAAIVLIGLLGYPLYQLVQISFYDYGQEQVSGGAPIRWLGLGNYTALLADPAFWTVLIQTMVFAAVCVVLTVVTGLLLAFLSAKLRPWVRTVLFVAALGAWAAPAVTGSTVWLFMFDANFGIVNEVLTELGLATFEGHSWTFGKISAFGLVAAEIVWCSFPFAMVTLYAALHGIPGEVLEAASLDGASAMRTLRSVIVPILRPALAVVTVQSIIWDMKIFGQIYIMTDGGGIAGQNLVLNVYAYQKAFAASQYGSGAAIGVVTVILLLAVSVAYLYTTRRRGEEL